jgi:predicted ATPase
MIRTLAVSGYRSVRDLALPLTGLDVVTGANGSGKSNVYRALRLIADMAQGGAVGALAREGGLEGVLWAGPEGLSRAMRDGEHKAQGTMRKGPIALRLGFASDDLGYLVDLGIPQRDPTTFESTMFGRDPEIKRELVFSGPVARPRSLVLQRKRQHVQVRDDEGGWIRIPALLPDHLSVLSEVADAVTSPEAMILRRRMTGWRFYDHLRTDAEAPTRGRAWAPARPCSRATGETSRRPCRPSARRGGATTSTRSSTGPSRAPASSSGPATASCPSASSSRACSACSTRPSSRTGRSGCSC